jgi:hypothetical protein
MAVLRVQPFEDIGTPAILINADRDGMRLFQSAVRSAHECGEATFEFNAIKHHVVRQDDAADIEVGPHTVVWRFDDAKLVEMLDLIPPLVDIPGPGHQYLDYIKSPVETLVLSVDEYVGHAPFGEFPQLLPVTPSAESQPSTASGVEGDDHEESPQAKPPPSPPTEQAGNEPAGDACPGRPTRSPHLHEIPSTNQSPARRASYYHSRGP